MSLASALAQSENPLHSEGQHPRAYQLHVEITGAVTDKLSEENALSVLQRCRLISGKRITGSSNYTFLVDIDAGDGRYLCAIYKPRDGERLLYDFPRGSLYKREYAAYLLSRALGWPNIPPTVIRDGPYGVGSVQLYIEAEPKITFFELVEDNADELMRFAVFDLLANNADRKAGHCLLGKDGWLWSIDHGLTFHSVFKLRTVMLNFWGAPIPQSVLDDLETLAGSLEVKAELAAGLVEILTEQETSALHRRLDEMLKDPVIPQLDPHHNVPWPLV